MANLKDLIVTGSARVLGTIYGNLVGNASTATKATQDGNGNVISSTYVSTSGNNTTNCIQITPTNNSANSYNEGIRIGVASNGWSNINFGCNNSSISGTQDSQWSVGKRGANGSKSGSTGDFTIENNGSTGTGLTLYKNGNTPTWNAKMLVQSSTQGNATGSTNQPVYINASGIATACTTQTIIPLITSYVDGASGYNIWANGYCEQWGTASFSNEGYVTFLKTFANTNYNMIACPYGAPSNATSDANWLAFPISKENTRCQLRLWDSDGNVAKTGNVSWRACGYLASGQY